MNVFLTGGTGFIGQPLTKSLLKRGWSVTALVRKPDSPRAQTLSRMGAQLAPGDVTERESMRAAMNGADIVVHNAGQYEYGMDRAGRERMRSVNVDGAENVLSLAHELKVARVVHVSTVQAFGETGSQARDETFTRQAPCRTFYEQSKTDAHEIARRYQERGTPLIIVCPHQVIGVNDGSLYGYYLRMYVNRIMPPIGWSPNSILCFVEVNDLAEGIALATEKGQIGETYFLCGEPQTIRDVFVYWSKKPGAIASRIWMPTALVSAMFAPAEPLLRALGLPAFISREIVRAGAINWHFSNEKAKRELGWRHCSAEEIWFGALDGELGLLSRRKGQNIIQRLEPLDVI